MIIRKTTSGDLPAIMQLYADARVFMRESGNLKQWLNSYPPQKIIEQDIEDNNSYVCIENNEIVATFFFNMLPDPTYTVINGKWLNQDPYGVVHRIAASRKIKGTGTFCLNWCFEQCHNLKIDTHCDNTPMQKLLHKLGFTYCGIIWLLNGDERMAFQKSNDISPQITNKYLTQTE